MMKYLNVFRIIYLFLLAFMFAHVILEQYGLAFTPVLWDIWFFGLCLTLFIHPWTIFYKTRIFQWRHLIFQFISAFLTLVTWLYLFLGLSFIPSPYIAISIGYQVEGQELIIIRGGLHNSYCEYHDLVNPWIMKSEVKYEGPPPFHF